MNTILRVVVDTNILVSALFGIKDSPSSQILHAFRSKHIVLISSAVIIAEIAEVVNRERIVKATKMTLHQREDFINKFIEESELTEGKQLPQKISRDVKDDKFLAC